MSNITDLSKIEKSFMNSCSEARLSCEQETFSNYLEPQSNDIFDTRRFSLQEKNSGISKTATPKACRKTSIGQSNKITNRANSVKLMTKCFYRVSPEVPYSNVKLVKRVENLEKKQELWKERANVWEKERKNFKKTINNIAGNPSKYYKTQLQNWNNSKFLKKVSEVQENLNPVQELKTLLEWIASQPESTPFRHVKTPLLQYYSKINSLENLIQTKSNDLDSILQDLSDRNEKLSSALQVIEAELKQKSEGLIALQEKIECLNMTLIEKEYQILEIKGINQQLQLQVPENSLNLRKVIELQSEIEGKVYEVLTLNTENKRLHQNLELSQTANNSYIKTIEELREKLKSLRIEYHEEKISKGYYEVKGFECNNIDHYCYCGKHCNFIDKVTADATTQTFFKPKHRKRQSGEMQRQTKVHEFIAYTSCMASAIEEFIITRNN